MKCTICKTDHTHPGVTTVTLQRDNTVVVIRQGDPSLRHNQISIS